MTKVVMTVNDLSMISQCQLTFSASDNDDSYLAANLSCLLQKIDDLEDNDSDDNRNSHDRDANDDNCDDNDDNRDDNNDNRDDSDDSYLPPHVSSLLQTPPHLFPNKLVASQGLQNPEHGQLGE